MPATITSLVVYGFNGDPCAETGADRRVFFSGFREECPANRRYHRLKANSLRLKGTSLNDVEEIRLSSSEDYRFAVLEKKAEGNDLIVYFLVWEPTRDEEKRTELPPTLGDLTVVIDTTTPVDTASETDSNVNYE